MTFRDRYDFCEKTAAYVALVTLHLATKIGDQVANKRVLERLSMILEAMLDGMRAEEIAWSLIPQPHSVPVPA